MRELKGEADLQLAKDVLCAFEEANYPNSQACSDIREGLYWDTEHKCYSADLGYLLRGEAEDVRIFEYGEKDDWLTPFPDMMMTGGWTLTAFVNFKGKLYFFCI